MATATSGAETALFPELRDKAVMSYGDDCMEKSIELIESYGLPGGLLPLKDVVEGGWVEETGFVWISTKKKQDHHFKRADRHCSYDKLVTCVMEKNKMKDIKGVKARDMLVWVPVNEITIDDKKPPKLHFKSFAGLSRSFTAELFARE